MDVLAGQVSGMVIGSVLQATITSNIEGLSGEVVTGLKGALSSQKIVKKMRGWQKASDHVPVVVELNL